MALQRKYNSIDLFKFIMAFFVVAIHTRPLNNIGNLYISELYNIILNMAVPFFFMASGFLLASKLTNPYNSEENIHIIKAYLIKIVKLYLIWSIIYLPLAVYDYIVSDISLQRAILLYIRGLFITGEHYNSWALWYLLSTIYTLCIILFLLKIKCSPGIILATGICIFLFGSAISCFINLDKELPYTLSLVKYAFEKTIGSGRILIGGGVYTCWYVACP